MEKEAQENNNYTEVYHHQKKKQNNQTGGISHTDEMEKKGRWRQS